uniref:Cyclin-dependent kinase 8 n=1 Tax=Chlamydomonas leiostraca TaxID=1034604 RepID=A0A7S0RU18_9CHLO|mmetsp:Transcript_31344/g.79967  ORF Transcript_31344/g.79967 Transcript_31344/m.79967 type:complete len:506 (+) Transcript_31344:47-1564(+)
MWDRNVQPRLLNDASVPQSGTASQQSQQQSGATQSIWSLYEKGEKIGEGTYGWVYHARSKENGRRYAIKQFKQGREGDGVSPTAIREIMLLRELKHDNVVSLEGVHLSRGDPQCLWLSFDYAEHDLYDMIRFHRDMRDNVRSNPHGLMPHHIIRSVMYQLLNGLSYLHQNWVIHRDLKPSNVLVMGYDEHTPAEAAGRVRIGDFGLARLFQSPLRPLSDNGVVVTIWYRAPELLLGSRHYTRAVDVWAAGCIFAELCGLRPLFQGSERKAAGAPFQADQADRIFRVLGHPHPKAWPHLQNLHHWHDNTDSVRVKQPHYPSAPPPGPGDSAGPAHIKWAAQQLEAAILEAMRAHLPSWAQGGIPSECRPPPEAYNLLARMLAYDPAQRISAEEALGHEYFTRGPRPSANVFAPPGAKEPAIRYPKRTVGVATAHHQGGVHAGQGTDAAGGRGGPGGFGSGRSGMSGIAGSGPGRPGGAGNAGAGGAAAAPGAAARKRKAEPLPGFR